MRKPSFIIISFLLVIAFLSQKCYGQTFDYKENAVYIFNFIKYTSWVNKKTHIEVGIVGNTPVEEELKMLFSKKKSSNLSFDLRRINPDQCSKYDILVIARDASDQLKNINEMTKKMPILIITEKPNMGKYGACISFFINEDDDYRIEYQLSMKNCRDRGLTMGEQIKNNAELMR